MRLYKTLKIICFVGIKYLATTKFLCYNCTVGIIHMRLLVIWFNSNQNVGPKNDILFFIHVTYVL